MCCCDITSISAHGTQISASFPFGIHTDVHSTIGRVCTASARARTRTQTRKQLNLYEKLGKCEKDHTAQTGDVRYVCLSRVYGVGARWLDLRYV